MKKTARTTANDNKPAVRGLVNSMPPMYETVMEGLIAPDGDAPDTDTRGPEHNIKKSRFDDTML